MTPNPSRPTGPEIAARMAYHFRAGEKMSRHGGLVFAYDDKGNRREVHLEPYEPTPAPVKRGNPVGWVLAFAAVVAVLATALALMT